MHVCLTIWIPLYAYKEFCMEGKIVANHCWWSNWHGNILVGVQLFYCNREENFTNCAPFPKFTKICLCSALITLVLLICSQLALHILLIWVHLEFCYAQQKWSWPDKIKSNSIVWHSRWLVKTRTNITLQQSRLLRTKLHDTKVWPSGIGKKNHWYQVLTVRIKSDFKKFSRNQSLLHVH